jgi:hypothetical protein
MMPCSRPDARGIRSTAAAANVRPLVSNLAQTGKRKAVIVDSPERTFGAAGADSKLPLIRAGCCFNRQATTPKPTGNFIRGNSATEELPTLRSLANHYDNRLTPSQPAKPGCQATHEPSSARCSVGF